jgi:hypothetical protein
MSALRRVLELFTGPRQSADPAASAGALPNRNDASELAFVNYTSGQVRDLLEHARSAGKRNLPATSAMTPNDAEQAVIHQAGEESRRAGTHVRARLAQLESKFAAVERDFPAVRDVQLLVTRALARIEEILGSDETIRDCAHRAELAQLAYRQVQDSLCTDRDPTYPESPTWHLAMVVVAFTVEAMLNASFFAEASAAGWSGGFSQAAILALVNVGGGYFAGTVLLRGLGYPQGSKRTWAKVGLAVYGMACVALNVTVAIWRDVATGAHPISIPSVILLLAGLLASALALWEGYQSDDSTPGLGRAHRAMVRAQRELAAAEQALLARLQAEIEQIPERGREVVRTAKKSLGLRAEYRGDALGLIDLYVRLHAFVQARARQSLHDYRGANHRVRRTPIPSYFKNAPTVSDELPDRSLPDRIERSVARDAARLPRLEAAVGRLERRQPERVAKAIARGRAYIERIHAELASSSRELGTSELAPRLRALPPSRRAR